jgi:hypothetical protein
VCVIEFKVGHFSVERQLFGMQNLKSEMFKIVFVNSTSYNSDSHSVNVDRGGDCITCAQGT